MARKTYKVIDLTGQVFHYWTVVKRLSSRPSDGPTWHCICKCGIEATVSGASLRKGKSKSCGCWNREINSKEYKTKMGKIHPKFINMTGLRFGRLVVLKQVENNEFNQIQWFCQCDCGVQKVYLGFNLRYGRTQSCGCYGKEKREEGREIHRMSKSKEYNSWIGMMGRCYNSNLSGYPYYGGRGIVVVEIWHKFANFYSDMGPKPDPSFSLERLDVNLGYSKENCIWASLTTQARNKRTSIRITFNGETKNLKGWAEILNISYGTLYGRIENGWSNYDALTRPVRLITAPKNM